MAKKKDQRPPLPKPIPAMRDLPSEEQDDYMERHIERNSIRELNAQLASVLKRWVNDVDMDDPAQFKAFNASGHAGEYNALPERTLARQLIRLGWTEDQIRRLNTTESPLDLMTVEELRYAAQRIRTMLDWFARHPQGGSFRFACAIYKVVGEVVRQAVIQQTGHPPEHFAPADVIITGKKDEAKRVQPAPYRAPLFPPDSDEEAKL